MAKKNREIWIESSVHSDNTRTLTIGSDWGCMSGFRKSDCKKLFEAVSATIKTIYPDAVINPWSDEPHSTPDFD